MFDLFYRRPPLRASFPSLSSRSEDSDSEEKPPSTAPPPNSETSSLREGYCSPGVPERLSFDQIKNGKTKNPASLREFMLYLRFIEHSSENLQFYLWYEDYIKRFDALSQAEKDLSPIYTSEPLAQQANSGSGTDESDSTTATQRYKSSKVGPVPKDYKTIARKAYSPIDNNQPFRDVIDQVVALYMVKGSPRELNLSARERKLTLRALAQTTHPSAFIPTFRQIDDFIRQYSHPNFISWGSSNQIKERFALAIFVLVNYLTFSSIAAIILTLSKAPRWYRLIPFPVVWLGITVIIAASRGICLLLWVANKCQFKTWELVQAYHGRKMGQLRRVENLKLPGEEIYELGSDNNSASNIAPWDDGYTSDYSDDYETEYKKIPFLRRVFALTKQTEDLAMRDIHTSILIQSVLMALPLAMCWAVIFVPLPKGNLF